MDSLIAPPPDTDAQAADALRSENQALRAQVLALQQQLQEQRQESAQLTTILDHLPVLIGYWDCELRNRFSNTAYQDWFGLRREDILGKHIREVIGEHLYALNLPYLEQVLQGKTLHFERDIRNPITGTLRRSWAHYIPCMDHNEVVGFFALVTDVTELKTTQAALLRSEAELREREERYRSMLMDQTELISRLRGDGTYLFANDVFCRFFGKRQDDLIGSTWNPLVYPDDLERVGQELAQLSKDNTVVMIENRVISCTGQVYWMQFSNRGFFSPTGELLEIQSVGRDITARKAAEAELLRVNEALTASRHTLRAMAAHNEALVENERKNFAREVHDELGQILTALRMDILYLEMAYCPQHADLADKVRSMKGLVDQTIQGVRNVAANLRPVALDMGLYEAFTWLCSEYSRKTGIPCRLYADRADCQVDEKVSVVLFRIVQESLTNITRHAQASRVQVTLQRIGTTLRCSVEDDGVGFDSNTPQTRSTFGLLGMQERALALGGELRLDSETNQGTCVSVTIPLGTTNSPADSWSMP